MHNTFAAEPDHKRNMAEWGAGALRKKWYKRNINKLNWATGSLIYSSLMDNHSRLSIKQIFLVFSPGKCQFIIKMPAAKNCVLHYFKHLAGGNDLKTKLQVLTEEYKEYDFEVLCHPGGKR
ncbi:MAG: hypothetical protein ACYC0Q_11240 [Eubacteriales bacterium]